MSDDLTHHPAALLDYLLSRRRFLGLSAGALATAVLAACGTAGSSGEEGEKKEISMAFVPSRDTAEIQLSGQKIADFIGKQTGYKVTSTTATSYAAVTQSITSKKTDLAWVSPLSYVQAHDQNGCYPITASIRNGTKGYKAFIIVKSDSDIKELKDLKGKRFAFGDPLSASGTLYPKAAMLKAGLNPDNDLKAQNISSASSVAIAVYQGQVDAGAFYDDARKNSEVISKFPDIMDKTRIIFTSDLIPADPQIVRKDLNKNQVAKLKAAMLKLNDDPDGKKFIQDLFTIDSLADASDSDYDVLREVVKTVDPSLLKPPADPTPTPKK
ncbi:MAG: phosphate/phosphite/phosphonate ABC transporter substrate-binding protein [Thermomicrobiales bacterium]